MVIDAGQVKLWAMEAGFDVVGVTRAEAIERGAVFRDYLERGLQGRMGYLEKSVEGRVDVRTIFPWARSLVCVGCSYYVGPEEVALEKGYGRIARYAWGRDYHEVMKEKLDVLADRIRQEHGSDVRLRGFSDAGPIAEKEHAARAGLGWVGKNTLLIHERYGSWVVLGELVTDLELAADFSVADLCGDCRRCIDACPTGALEGPRRLNAKRCLSYATIEAKGDVDLEVLAKNDCRVFGCDLCQEVCPYNQKAEASGKNTFSAEPGRGVVKLEELVAMNEEEFQKRFAGSSVLRAGREQVSRMAAICQENQGPALTKD